jgi:hypothetical protein
MRMLVLSGLVLLGGCGGGGTTGTNYSDPPPMATIVATPSPEPSATPEAVTNDETPAVDNADEAGNDADSE